MFLDDNNTKNAKRRWRLFHYLAHNSKSSFSFDDVDEDEEHKVARHQNRFLFVMFCVGVLWFIFRQI